MVKWVCLQSTRPYVQWTVFPGIFFGLGLMARCTGLSWGIPTGSFALQNTLSKFRVMFPSDTFYDRPPKQCGWFGDAKSTRKSSKKTSTTRRCGFSRLTSLSLMPSIRGDSCRLKPNICRCLITSSVTISGPLSQLLSSHTHVRARTVAQR